MPRPLNRAYLDPEQMLKDMRAPRQVPRSKPQATEDADIAAWKAAHPDRDVTAPKATQAPGSRGVIIPPDDGSDPF